MRKNSLLDGQLPSNIKSFSTESGKLVPEILFITSYPPRECGIATYSQDLIRALRRKFKKSFEISVCALENEYEKHKYPSRVKYLLNTNEPSAFLSMSKIINHDPRIEIVVIQHEFGFFAESQKEFISFLESIKKPIVTVFHTVLPEVSDDFRDNVKKIAQNSDRIIVMTNTSAGILSDRYGVEGAKISVIAHGTHLAGNRDKLALKEKYGVSDRKILSTFGLLSSGKSIETTLDALKDVIKTKPDVLFLILGKTHPGIVKREGEKYRRFLEQKVSDLGLQDNVKFVNKYLPLEELLEYLHLTDIYLFTSKDPHQAVSGTFSYAVSSGCAIISTPIPHAREFLSGDSGIIIDFEDSKQLGEAINRLLFDVNLRHQIKHNAMHKIVPTSWPNSAIAHADLFDSLSERISLKHKRPEISLDHIKRLTTDFGMIQFSKLSKPDPDSGYTLDDNARALIAVCEYYELTKDASVLRLIDIYLDFIGFCQQADGTFMNFVSKKQIFTEENQNCNLEDANGRAIWALGYLISDARMLPKAFREKADIILERAMINIEGIHSPRAMAFIIKGLYYYNTSNKSKAVRLLIKKLADRLTQMYLAESSTEWQWFESYLTYANSTLPEALIYAYRETGEDMYREVAKATFEFLLSQTFNEKNEIKVISNNNWYVKGGERNHFGEQPIDVAYTVFALNSFYSLFGKKSYKRRMNSAFEWFLGRNHLNQIIYNPATGGCHDGLEEHTVNLNQGAESAVSYLLARLCVEKADAADKAEKLKLKKQTRTRLVKN